MNGAGVIACAIIGIVNYKKSGLGIAIELVLNSTENKPSTL